MQIVDNNGRICLPQPIYWAFFGKRRLERLIRQNRDLQTRLLELETEVMRSHQEKRMLQAYYDRTVKSDANSL